MTQRISPKTPYEIRLELLELARIILQNRSHHHSNAPTTEEVIAEAEKMNVFVSNSAQSNHQ